MASNRHEDGTWFNVELVCTKTNKAHCEKITFSESTPPITVADVKDKVEEVFSIPVCVQKLTYEAYPLSDCTSLEGARVRSGDTFQVSYSAEGDCEEIRKAVKWFELIKEFLEKEDPTLDCPMSNNLEELMVIEEEFVDNLTYKYFLPWLDAKTNANKLYFVQCGGLDVIMRVYALLQRHPWTQCVLHLKHLELGILQVLWSFSENFQQHRLILARNGLELCIQSLLRQKLEEGERIEDKTNSFHRSNSWVLVETIGAALGMLSNLSELEDCHMPIASNEACLDQLTCISLTPTYIHVLSVQLVATLFLCMAYTPSTHPFLTRPLLLRRLMEANDKSRNLLLKNNDPEEEKLSMLFLRYRTQLFLAHVVLASPQLIPEEFREKIHDFMQEFLQTASYQVIMAGEVKRSTVWYTFLPYIKLLYLPDTEVSRREQACSETMRGLHTLSLQTILLGLQNMLGRDNHREVLVQEGLEDYVTCLTCHLPPGLLREQARELVRIVGSGGMQLQPPRLVNLVKAKLAKVHFGLERVHRMSVGEIVNELLPSQIAHPSQVSHQ